jgi:hypothetical protein
MYLLVPIMTYLKKIVTVFNLVDLEFFLFFFIYIYSQLFTRDIYIGLVAFLSFLLIRAFNLNTK